MCSNVALVAIALLSKDPFKSVTVCADASTLVQVTDAPVLILIDAGENAKFLMLTAVEAGTITLLLFDLEQEEIMPIMIAVNREKTKM